MGVPVGVKTWMAATAAAVGLLGANMAQAATWLADNGLTGDDQLKASADISLSGDVLTVVLTNTLADNQLRSQGAAISGVVITFDDPLASLPTITGDSGTLVNFNNSAVATPTGGTTLTHWGLVNVSGALRLTTLTGGQPSQLIINDSPSYSHTNPGFQNGQFNPFVKGPGTFTLDFGANQVAEIASVVFQFGTQPDASVAGSCTGDCLLHHTTLPTPEPATWAMMLMGFFGAGALIRRRRLAAA